MTEYFVRIIINERITQYVPFCLSKPKTINAILSAFTNFRTWSTPLFINISLLKLNKRELIKISIQFVCKLQSIFFIYQSQPLYIFTSYSLVFIFIKTHLLYMIARVSFWQFDKKHHFKRGFCLTNRKIRIFCPVCSNFEIIIVED